MRQGLACQIVIDKRRLRANGPQRKPHKHKGVRVLKVHGHDILGLDAKPGLDPVAVAEDFVVRLRIRVRLAVKHEERLVGVAGALGMAFQRVEEVDCVCSEVAADADGGLDDGLDEAVVVPEGGFGVEVGQGGGGGGEDDGERDWHGDVSLFTMYCMYVTVKSINTHLAFWCRGKICSCK